MTVGYYISDYEPIRGQRVSTDILERYEESKPIDQFEAEAFELIGRDDYSAAVSDAVNAKVEENGGKRVGFDVVWAAIRQDGRFEKSDASFKLNDHHRAPVVRIINALMADELGWSFPTRPRTNERLYIWGNEVAQNVQIDMDADRAAVERSLEYVRSPTLKALLETILEDHEVQGEMKTEFEQRHVA